MWKARPWPVGGRGRCGRRSGLGGWVGWVAGGRRHARSARRKLSSGAKGQALPHTPRLPTPTAFFDSLHLPCSPQASVAGSLAPRRDAQTGQVGASSIRGVFHSREGKRLRPRRQEPGVGTNPQSMSKAGARRECGAWERGLGQKMRQNFEARKNRRPSLSSHTHVSPSHTRFSRLCDALCLQTSARAFFTRARVRPGDTDPSLSLSFSFLSFTRKSRARATQSAECCPPRSTPARTPPPATRRGRTPGGRVGRWG